MKLRRHVTLLTFLFSLTSCSDGITGPESYRPIESRIIIQLWERLSPGQRSLEFHCATEKIYSCFNYRIRYRLYAWGQTFGIEFVDIAIPELCATAFGPATAVIDLGLLQSKTFGFPVIVNDHTTGMQLDVSDDVYRVTSNDNVWIVFQRPELLRVPDQTIWGSVGYHSPGSASLVQSFSDSLQALGARETRYQPGYYGYYEIDSAGTIKPPENHGYYFILPFIYWYTNDMTALRDLVKRYGKAYGEMMNISVHGSRGETWYSWVLNNEP